MSVILAQRRIFCSKVRTPVACERNLASMFVHFYLLLRFSDMFTIAWLCVYSLVGSHFGVAVQYDLIHADVGMPQRKVGYFMWFH